jgi:hypothetical protein
LRGCYVWFRVDIVLVESVSLSLSGIPETYRVGDWNDDTLGESLPLREDELEDELAFLGDVLRYSCVDVTFGSGKILCMWLVCITITCQGYPELTA